MGILQRVLVICATLSLVASEPLTLGPFNFEIGNPDAEDDTSSVSQSSQSQSPRSQSQSASSSSSASSQSQSSLGPINLYDLGEGNEAGRDALPPLDSSQKNNPLGPGGDGPGPLNYEDSGESGRQRQRQKQAAFQSQNDISSDIGVGGKISFVTI